MNDADKELLEKYKLTEFTFSIIQKSKDTNYMKILQNLVRLGYLTSAGFLTKKGESIIDKYTKGSFKYSEEDMEELTKIVRNLYPTGIKPGSNKPWRGTEKEVLKKLYSVMKQFPDITGEEVINAVKKYLNTGESQYRRTLPYFIEKYGESDLYTYIQEIRESGNNIYNNDTDDDGGHWL
ncbi:MAG: hypothetical protein IJ715_05685 [Bacilli bacterium]|nr:hypothetical protein [Bacilli bacterium]